MRDYFETNKFKDGDLIKEVNDDFPYLIKFENEDNEFVAIQQDGSRVIESINEIAKGRSSRRRGPR